MGNLIKDATQSKLLSLFYIIFKLVSFHVERLFIQSLNSTGKHLSYRASPVLSVTCPMLIGIVTSTCQVLRRTWTTLRLLARCCKTSMESHHQVSMICCGAKERPALHSLAWTRCGTGGRCWK